MQQLLVAQRSSGHISKLTGKVVCSLQPHDSDYLNRCNMLEQARYQFLSSMADLDERDVEALLAFREAITSHFPNGRLVDHYPNGRLITQKTYALGMEFGVEETLKE